MNLTFYKYQGTGNDFVLIDNRTKIFPKKNTDKIAHLCNRYFGIGADGLILLENDINTDFKMIYYNADGNESTMCGNGGRCIVAFAHQLGIIKKETTFSAIDGLHKATIINNKVALQMIDVTNITPKGKGFFTDTGSPHHVQFVDNIANFHVVNEGRKIRKNIYGTTGSNVNFVEQIDNTTFKVRTYERGVENETLACGTGVTAVALTMHKTQKTTSKMVKLIVQGGELEVTFTTNKNGYQDIFLIGNATFVFKGKIEI